MSRALFLLGALAVAACGQPVQQENDVAVSNVAAAAAGDCTAPTLAIADSGEPLGQGSQLLGEIRSNFDAAFKNACAKGVLESKELIDSKSADKNRIFLVNAPEANVASIYLSDVDGGRMVLEYPFLTVDGKSQVPTVAELEEAIYCAAVGATPEEQESSGRCLVD